MLSENKLKLTTKSIIIIIDLVYNETIQIYEFIFCCFFTGICKKQYNNQDKPFK